MIIAAVAETNACTVVTDNEKNFDDIQILNPLRESL
jgi:predicted nucleic acid-binding protein